MIDKKQKTKSNKHNKPTTRLIILILALFCSAPLMLPGFIAGNDIIPELYRVADYSHIMQQGIFPIRWSGDLFSGYGYPIYNFFPPLFLTLSSLLILIGFPIQAAVKFMIVFLFIVSGYGYYLFARNFFKQDAAILAGCLYFFSYYFLLDVYMRDAFAESLALTIVPYLFHYVYRFLTRRRYDYVLFICSSVALAALLISHLLTSVMFLLVLCLFALVVIIASCRWRGLFRLFQVLLTGFLLSAFFILPAVAEVNLVKITNALVENGTYIYQKHFLSFYSLFLDNKSHWYLSVFPLIVLILSLRGVAGSKFLRRIAGLFFFLFMVLALLMSTGASRFLWDSVPWLKFFQFPWRFLALANFCLPFLACFVFIVFRKNHRFFAGLVYLYVFLIFIHFPLFNVEHVFTLQENLPSSTIVQSRHTTTLSNEYMPKTVDVYPAGIRERWVRAVQFYDEKQIQQVKVRPLGGNNYSRAFSLNVPGDVLLTMNMLYFPGWCVYINGKEVPARAGEEGLITFRASAGESKVIVVFCDTPERKAGNLLSLIGLIYLLVCSFVDAFAGKRKPRPRSRKRNLLARARIPQPPVKKTMP